MGSELGPVSLYNLYVATGSLNRLRVTFDPDRNLYVKVERIVRGEDLVKSIDIACRLKYIAPQGICQSLRAKARAAADAMARGNSKAATGEINAFLNELRAQGGKHVREPALTILREEAETLLSDLSRTGMGGAVSATVLQGSAVKPNTRKPWWWPF